MYNFSEENGEHTEGRNGEVYVSKVLTSPWDQEAYFERVATFTVS